MKRRRPTTFISGLRAEFPTRRLEAVRLLMMIGNWLPCIVSTEGALPELRHRFNSEERSRLNAVAHPR